MSYQTEFNKVAKNVIYEYIHFIKNQNFDVIINDVNAIDENKNILVLGIEIGFIRAEMENLFLKNENRVMNPKERHELYELIDQLAVPIFKEKILGT